MLEHAHAVLAFLAQLTAQGGSKLLEIGVHADGRVRDRVEVVDRQPVSAVQHLRVRVPLGQHRAILVRLPKLDLAEHLRRRAGRDRRRPAGPS